MGGGLGHLVMMKVAKLQPVILRAAQNDRRVPVLGQRLLLCQYKAQNVEISKESKRRHSKKFERRLFC